MKNFVNDQLRRFELVKERQRIINELNALEASSTVSLIGSKEFSSNINNFLSVNLDIFSWLDNSTITSNISELATPIYLSGSAFDNTSVFLSNQGSDPWVQSFFKDNFIVKAKIKSVEKAHFKIFTP